MARLELVDVELARTVRIDLVEVLVDLTLEDLG